MNPNHTPDATPLATATSDRPDVPQTFCKLLVGLDRTNASSSVFQRALALAKAQNSHLFLFHGLSARVPTPNVLVAGSLGVYGGGYTQEMLDQAQQWADEERQQVLVWLRELCDQAIAAGVAAEFDYRDGEPGQQMCALARNWDADLLIVGRRGRAGLSELVLGSVSNYVVHHAHCAVLVVQ
ncbi:MAG: universal stress protein [Spirulinaceae cyanobacterium SM2_1_0]|nr:universal stress protein [Spirulinaceae cyanobacterium SM2_1_0]